MKALEGYLNQEKARVGAFSVIVKFSANLSLNLWCKLWLCNRRQSARPEVDYSGGREGQEAGQALPIPQMLDILDKVEPPPPPDERSVHSPGG